MLALQSAINDTFREMHQRRLTTKIINFLSSSPTNLLDQNKPNFQVQRRYILELFYNIITGHLFKFLL